jgi:hypothetical protein
MAVFQNQGFGALIQQAAQGIITQFQNKQQMQLQVEALKERQEQTEINNKLKQEEFKIREQTLKMQEEQTARAAAFAPLKEAKITAETANLDARTAALLDPKKAAGNKPLTDVARKDLAQLNEIDAERAEINDLSVQFNMPLLGSTDKFLQSAKELRARIQKAEDDPKGFFARGLVEKQGKVPQLVRDKERLAALDKFTTSDEFTSLKIRQDSTGALPETRKRVFESGPFAMFASQMDFSVPPTSAVLLEGNRNLRKEERGTELLKEGNPEMLADAYLEEFSNGIGRDEHDEIVRRQMKLAPDPDTDPEGHRKAFENLKRMFEIINNRKNK